MNIKTFAMAATMAIACTVGASAQGVVGGAEQGARDGNRAAGPVGGVVGGVVGAVGGGVAGLLGLDQRPRFREYVVSKRYPSYTYDRPVAVGAILPEQGVVYYDVPSEYGVQGYRYTIINGQPVLVDTRSRSIVQIVE